MCPKLSLTACVVVVLLLPATGWSQIVGDSVPANTQASWNTANSGTVALRAPGNVVDRARGQFVTSQNQLISRARFGASISDQASTEPTLVESTQVQVVQILLDNLNALLLALAVSAGLDGSTPPVDGGTITNLTNLLGNISGPV